MEHGRVLRIYVYAMQVFVRPTKPEPAQATSVEAVADSYLNVGGICCFVL